MYVYTCVYIYILESSGALRAPSILCAASPRLESAAQMAVTMSMSNFPSSLLGRQKRAYDRQSDRIGHFLFVMFPQNFCRCPPLFLALLCLYMCARVRMCGHEIKVRGWRGCAGDRVVSVARARASSQAGGQVGTGQSGGDSDDSRPHHEEFALGCARMLRTPL